MTTPPPTPPPPVRGATVITADRIYAFPTATSWSRWEDGSVSLTDDTRPASDQVIAVFNAHACIAVIDGDVAFTNHHRATGQ